MVGINISHLLIECYNLFACHTYTLLSRFDIVISATGYGKSEKRLPKLARDVLTAGKIRKTQDKGRIWFFPRQWDYDFDVMGDVRGLMSLFCVQRKIWGLLREEAKGAGFIGLLPRR